ncbi:MAG: NYN domain-containing protein, partial [Anaerolineae bacterium]
MADEQLSNLPRQKIAMLIDGDNAQAGLLSQMLVEAARYGQVTVRRIYGDWTTSNMNSWKETLNFHAFQPIQQFRYTIGKNATDSAMIIDAMDVLHSNAVDAFCLVSSDSDYTRLATR